MLIQSSLSNQKLETNFNDNLNLIKQLFIMIISELNESSQLKYKLFSLKGFYPDILFLKLDYFSKKICILKIFCII